LAEEEKGDEASEHEQIAAKSPRLPVWEVVTVEKLRRGVGGIAGYSKIRVRYGRPFQNGTADIANLKSLLPFEVQNIRWLYVLMGDLCGMQLLQTDRRVLSSFEDPGRFNVIVH
jgi:hypothetical protein